MLNVLLAEAPDNVATLLRFFAPQGGLLLDISYGIGNLLSACPDTWSIVGSDCVGSPDVLADWSALPYREGVADAVLYDPPYLVGRASRKLYERKDSDWLARHTSTGEIDHGPPIMEASRVLRPGGLFIAKVQNSRFRGSYIAHDAAIRESLPGAGLRLRDLVVYIRLAVGVFKIAQTPQQAYGFYIVAEKGGKVSG